LIERLTVLLLVAEHAFILSFFKEKRFCHVKKSQFEAIKVASCAFIIYLCLFLECRLFKGLLFVKNEGCVGLGILFYYAKKYEKMK